MLFSSGKHLLNSLMSMKSKLPTTLLTTICVKRYHALKNWCQILKKLSEASVQLLTSSANFLPASIPKEEPDILEYGRTEMQDLVGFYEEQASVEFEGVTYTSEALIDAVETVAEWRIFKRAVVRERDEMM